MTDQRTLKTIIGEQRGTIEKQKVVIDELNTNYLKLNEKFDSLHDDFILQSEAWQKTIDKNKASEAKIEAANKKDFDYQNWLFLAKAHAESEVIGAVYSICLDKFLNIHSTTLALQIPRNREQSPEIPMRDRERLSQSAESPLPTGKDTKVARVRDNSVSPRKEGCKIGGLPQNVPACKELKEEAKSK
jgi:hypothetical protein